MPTINVLTWSTLILSRVARMDQAMSIIPGSTTRVTWWLGPLASVLTGPIGLDVPDPGKAKK